MAHREKKGIVPARNSKVTPETKKRAKERTETETRKLHYVMKLPCFIERYVCHTKAIYMHCCRTLIIRARFYFRHVKKNDCKPIKHTGNAHGTSLREAFVRQLLTDTRSILQIVERTWYAPVYDEA